MIPSTSRSLHRCDRVHAVTVMADQGGNTPSQFAAIEPAMLESRGDARVCFERTMDQQPALALVHQKKGN